MIMLLYNLQESRLPFIQWIMQFRQRLPKLTNNPKEILYVQVIVSGYNLEQSTENIILKY